VRIFSGTGLPGKQAAKLVVHSFQPEYGHFRASTKGVIPPPLMSLVVDKQIMRPGYWTGSVLRVSLTPLAPSGSRGCK